jgi:hypothetical protein
MIRDEETAVFLAVCRKLRHRRKWHDIQEVARYNRDKASGFSRLSSAEPSADCVELQPVQSWVIDHNDSLVEQSARDSRQYRQMRLESIRHRQQFRKLERMAAQLMRRELSPVFRAASTQCAMPLPSLKLASDDKRTLSAELLALLSTLRGEFRSEVESTCWIVQGDYPTADSGKVFRRACNIVRWEMRGVYQDRRWFRDEQQSVAVTPAAATSASLRYWNEQSAKLNRLERIELAILIANTQAGKEVIDAMLAGKSRKQIAEELGISLPTLCRRMAAIGTGEQVAWSNGRVFVRTGD